MERSAGRRDSRARASFTASARARELADGFEQAHAEFCAFVEAIPDDRWTTPTSETDPRPVGVVACHVAWGCGFEQGYFQAIAERTPKPPVPEFDTINDALADRWRSRPQAEVVTWLRSAGAATATWVRGLSDEQLARTGQYWVGSPTRTVDQWIEKVLIGHIVTHLRDLRSSLAAWHADHPDDSS